MVQRPRNNKLMTKYKGNFLIEKVNDYKKKKSKKDNV